MSSPHPLYKQRIILTEYDNNTHINFDNVLISSDNKFLVTWGNGIINRIREGKIKIFKLTSSSETPTEIEFNESIQSGIADVKLSPDNKYLVVIMLTKDHLNMGNGYKKNAQAALIYDFSEITSAEQLVEASGGRRQSRRHRRQSRRRRQTRKR